MAKRGGKGGRGESNKMPNGQDISNLIRKSLAEFPTKPKGERGNEQQQNGKEQKKQEKRERRERVKEQREEDDETAGDEAKTSPDPVKQLEIDLNSIIDSRSLAIHEFPPVPDQELGLSAWKSTCIELATLLEVALHRLSEAQSELDSLSRRRAGRHVPPHLSNTSFQPLGNYNNREPGRSSWPSPSLSGSSGSRSSPQLLNFLGRSSVSQDLSRKMSFVMTSPTATHPTPHLWKFLEDMRGLIESKNPDLLAQKITIDNQTHDMYVHMSHELKEWFPAKKDAEIFEFCQALMPQDDESSRGSWEQFAGFLSQWLLYVRDCHPYPNLTTIANRLRALLIISNTCLGDPNLGFFIVPCFITVSKLLIKALLELSKTPDSRSQSWTDPLASDGGKQLWKLGSFLEDATDRIREGFTKCLTDRSGSSGFGKHATPEGKRKGIYQAGSLCLKLLLHGRKVSSMTTIFSSVDAQAPLLSHFPAAQRVTYLYYLGRYHFANNHFYRAQLALQAAYDQCHVQALQHRRLILVYLIASNMCLGRFPSTMLLQREEAAEAREHFFPLIAYIRTGNLAEFKNFLNLGNLHADWFLGKRMLFQMRNRCEPLVWRSLARRVFLDVGFRGEDNKTPFFRLYFLQAAAQWMNQRTLDSLQGNQDEEASDSEFEGMESAIAESGFDMDSGIYAEPVGQSAESSVSLTTSASSREPQPTLEEIESIMASLIQQDLLQGFLTHNNPRFAIPGAKTKGALAVGFPPVWGVIRGRHASKEVPGWVKEDVSTNALGGNMFGSSFGGGGPFFMGDRRPFGAVAG